MNTGMKRQTFLMIALASLLLLAASLSPAAEIPWNAVTGGGGIHTQVGIYTLDSAIGQPVTGLYSVSTSTLCSGFLCQAIATWPVYLPIVRK